MFSIRTNLARVPEVAHTLSFYPRGSKLSLVSLYEQPLQATGEIRADFQHCQIWPGNLHITQNPRSCTCTLFQPKGFEIQLICTLWRAVSEIRADFQNCHTCIWAWNVDMDQCSRSCTYNFFPPQGFEIERIFALRAAVLRYWLFFKIAIFGHETWPLAKVPEVAHILSFYPRGSKIVFENDYLSMHLMLVLQSTST